VVKFSSYRYLAFFSKKKETTEAKKRLGTCLDFPRTGYLPDLWHHREDTVLLSRNREYRRIKRMNSVPLSLYSSLARLHFTSTVKLDSLSKHLECNPKIRPVSQKLKDFYEFVFSTF